VQRIRELNLCVRPAVEWTRWRLGGIAGWQPRPAGVATARLLQIDDRRFNAPGRNGYRAPGWIEWANPAGLAALALRDFWQTWPKAFEVQADEITLGLFPRFTPGQFNHLQPSHKYGYLFDGACYRLRTGQAPRWEAWIDVNGDGAGLAAGVNQPLVPVADSKAALASGAWGTLCPAGGKRTRRYDRWVDKLFAQYQRSIERQRDYGAMNWGDWYGERFVNWGNHEYDTPSQFFIHFARSGDLRCFYAGDTAARHMADVDVVHAVNEDLAAYFYRTAPWRSSDPVRPGLVHEHCVGHVGGFHSIDEIKEIYRHSGLAEQDQSYLCLEPFNLGHVWTEGLVRHYFLTGDPWSRETVASIADNLAGLAEQPERRWLIEAHGGRETGWPLLALAAAHELTGAERYVRAMRRLADEALATQDPVCGGWLFELPQGHCNCQTRRHVGKAGFILSILVNGLSRYAEVTGDPRIAPAVRRAITHLNNDTWRDELGDWRYTSCPASPMVSQPGVTMLALVNSVRLAGDREQLRILRRAWERKLSRLLRRNPGQSAGKEFSATLYGSAETVALLLQCHPDKRRGMFGHKDIPSETINRTANADPPAGGEL
jgi:hypothetical protein